MNDNTDGFSARCYELLKLIPEGKVTTYREIANAMNTKAWRAVGTAMAKNKNLISTPCHRVIRSDGNIGQYASGADKKAEILIKEGVAIIDGKVEDLKKYMYKFST